MEAQAWTAIGLLAATLVGWLYFLVPRIRRLERAVDALEARVDALIDGHKKPPACTARGRPVGANEEPWFDDRLDLVDTLLAGLSLKLDDHLRRHAG